MSFLTKTMVDAIQEGIPEPVHTIEINNRKFILVCDVEGLTKGIESIRDKFDNDRAQYGYQEYKGDPDKELTKKEFNLAIDDFYKEFEKKLDIDYAKKIVKKAKKKKNCTLHKNRVYDEYTLRAVANNGSGAVRMYTLRYKTEDDLIIRLEIHYSSKLIQYTKAQMIEMLK